MTQYNDEFDEVELQRLLDQAKSLPREVPPAPEAWSNIQDRIESSRVRALKPQALAVANNEMQSPDSETPARSATPRRGMASQTRIVFAAAAVLFVAVTTLAVLNERVDDAAQGAVAAGPPASLGNTSSGSPSPESPVQTSTSPAPASSAPTFPASSSLASVFAQYDEAASDLTKDLDQRRSRLQPEAVAVLDSCLTTLDRAIKESRSALASSPDNTTIADLLQIAYQQKLDLLRRATELPLGSL